MKALIIALTLGLLNNQAFAAKGNIIDELDPSSPDIKEQLKIITEYNPD
jgi:hypothetical protein